MPYKPLIRLAVLLAAWALVYLAYRAVTKKRIPFPSLLAYVGALLLLPAVAEAVLFSRRAPGEILDSVRAFLEGYRLYPQLFDGPFMPSIYGPLSYLAFIPSALFPTPLAAIVAATCTVFLFLLAPLPVFFLRRGEKTPAWALACVGGLTLFISCLLNTGTMCFWFKYAKVRTDSVAIGLGALACGIVYAFVPLRRGGVAACGFLAVAAFFAKQTMAPLALALLVYVWLARGWEMARWYLAGAGGGAVFLLATCAALFDLKLMALYTVIIPSLHPMKSPFFLHNLWAAWYKFTQFAWPPILFLGAACLIAVRAGACTSVTAFRQWVGQERWNVVLWAGISLVPTAFLAFSKRGGWLNNFSAPLYFFWLALFLCGAACVLSPGSPAAVRAGAKYAFAGALVFFSLVHAGAPFRIYREIVNPPLFPADVAYRYALRHPGKTYFPECAFSSMLAEGKVYHALNGAIDLGLAGYQLDERKWAEYVPSGIGQVAYTPECGYRQFLPPYLREFSVRVDDPGLPGFEVYVRKG